MSGVVDVSWVSARRIGRQNAIKHKAAVRRCAMKRWLRARGICYPVGETYDENALRKRIRGAIARVQGGPE